MAQASVDHFGWSRVVLFHNEEGVDVAFGKMRENKRYNMYQVNTSSMHVIID